MKTAQRITKKDGEVVNRDKLVKWFNRYLDKMADGEYTLAIDDTTRTSPQNAYYWVCLGIIATEIGTTPDYLHSFYKEQFLPKEEYIVLIQSKQKKSTTQQTRHEFAEYLDKVIRHAAEMGVILPDIEEYKHQ